MASTIELIAKSPFPGSGPRGIDVYARLLYTQLSKHYPMESLLLSSDTPSGQLVDLVHYSFFDLFFLTLWGKRIPSKFVVTVHDVIPLLFPSHFPIGLRGRVKFRLQRRALQAASAVITDSECSKNDIHHHLAIPLNRIFVVPLAAGHTSVTSALIRTVKVEYKLPERFILYVGDINWNKNIPGLIEAYAALKTRQTHLVLVGKAFISAHKTPEFAAIQTAISRSGYSDQIHLVGFVPGHHLPAIYAAATLYVQPSWYEGFGLPILEALSKGTPVISSNQGSLPEVGGAHVHYFDPHHQTEFVTLLKSLLRSASRRTAYLQSGQAWAKTFTWDRTAQSTAKVYASILASHPPV